MQSFWILVADDLNFSTQRDISFSVMEHFCTFWKTQWLSLCQDYIYIYMNAIAQQYLKVHIEKLCQLSETVSWGIKAVL